ATTWDRWTGSPRRRSGLRPALTCATTRSPGRPSSRQQGYRGVYRLAARRLHRSLSPPALDGWRGPMADGGWHNGLAEPPARERFEDVLSEFAGRLASAEPMRRETAVALVQQLERLGRRMAREQEIAEGRSAELDAALAALSERLEVQATASAAREAELTLKVDRLVADLAEARAARRPLTDARAVRAILAAVAACAALCGAGAGVIVFNRPQAPKAARTLPVVVAAPAQPQPENPRPIAAAVEGVAAAKAAPLVAE